MADKGNPLVTLRSWHRPLVVLAGVMGVLCAASLLGLFFDDRTLVNAPVWLKPFKFSVSVGLYALTLAWLLTHVRRGRRAGWWFGTVFAAGIGLDVGLIVVQMIFRGTTLHFNKATPADVMINNVVAGGAYAAWLMTAAVVVLLLFQRLPDRALTSALRWGTGLALAGMGVAMLMFSPSPAQRAVLDAGGKPSTFGAHSVGVEDGGPGLPVLGWSTAGGDMRIPHFVGIHGLQVLPLVAFGLLLLARRYPVLSADAVRRRVVRIAGAGYAGLLALLTWQAQRGQSIVHPDFWTLAAAFALALAVAGAAAVAVRPSAEILRSAR
ncbi:hypothetical protein [Amycolatopsis sp. SID8362]|uniref:hypothetical protein n=1 Tax=Amycolatopsis sp. SID8362 TaxID=2690346 RepID=UPI00137106FF|nr:hypothetical protein [Amycolatopsis sp. SID8362]NBH11580.1 hypothetical protein [Amycolatopsis sp. SID8362]NED48272.1 hypothetical protein [Amycolatopsis sp. SID8362]